jgi:hypothetical protein
MAGWRRRQVTPRVQARVRADAAVEPRRRLLKGRTSAPWDWRVSVWCGAAAADLPGMTVIGPRRHPRRSSPELTSSGAPADRGR